MCGVRFTMYSIKSTKNAYTVTIVIVEYISATHARALKMCVHVLRRVCVVRVVRVFVLLTCVRA